jgi:predicted nucleotide-binding protein
MPPPKEQSLALLRRSLEGVSSLGQLEKYSVEHEKWERSARSTIGFVFGKESPYLSQFGSTLQPYSSQVETYPVWKADAFRKISPKVTALLETMIDEVELYWGVGTLEMTPGAKEASVSSRDKNIFIIHGHDAGAKEEVARFISKLGLNPIILHEHANAGRTVIEKFEEHAEVSYAIAILTPDDVGASNAERESLRPRARQNVLFEFGYFIGKLGRGCVCGLIKGNVETPSDYSGVLYIHLDAAGAWRIELLRELKAAKLQIDANAVL